MMMVFFQQICKYCKTAYVYVYVNPKGKNDQTPTQQKNNKH